jgi:hypothetical protein
LTAPFTQINATTASWTPVAGATAYEVAIDDSITQKSELAYQLDELASGTHSIKVRAINGSSEGAWSNIVSHTVTGTGNGSSLMTPSIKFVAGGIGWSAISGATSYDIDKNDVISNQTQTTYTEEQFGPGAGTKTIRVRARNGNEMSDWSNTSRPTVGIIRPDATLSNNTLIWSANEDARAGYDISMDGNLSPLQMTTSYSVAGASEGVHQITARAQGRTPSGPYLYSEWSRPIGWTVGSSTTTPAEPLIGLKEEIYTKPNFVTTRANSIWWSAVLGATGYDVELDGTVIVQNQPFLSYNSENLVAGTHRIKVRSVNGSYKSDWSNEIAFDPSTDMSSVSSGGEQKPNNLPTPKMVLDKNVFTWDAISGARVYEFEVNAMSYITDKLSATLPSGIKGSVSVRVRALNNTDRLSQWSNVYNLEVN